jgi:hypothetical protein
VPINEPERTEPTNVLLTSAPIAKGDCYIPEKVAIVRTPAALWDPPKFAIAPNEASLLSRLRGTAPFAQAKGRSGRKRHAGDTLVGVPAVVSRVWKNLTRDRYLIESVAPGWS